MAPSQTQMVGKAGSLPHRVLVITRDVEWTYPLARAGIFELTVLEFPDGVFPDEQEPPTFDMVVVQPGETGPVALTSWLDFGSASLRNTGVLTLDLSHQTGTLPGGVSDVSDAGAPRFGWVPVNSTVVGEVALLELSPVDGGEGVSPEGALAVVRQASRAVEDVVHSSLSRESEMREEALASLVKQRDRAEEEKSEAASRNRRLKRRLRRESRERRELERRLRALNETTWVRMANRYWALRRRGSSAVSNASSKSRILKAVFAVVLVVSALLAITWSYGWLASTAIVVVALQVLVVLQLRRTNRGSASRDRAIQGELRAQKRRSSKKSRQLRTIAQSQRQISGRTTTRLNGLASQLRQQAGDAENRAENRHAGTVRDLRLQYEQVQGAMNLFALADAGAPMPPLRGWAISPDALLIVLAHLLRDRPKLVLECGSGSSTVWMALAIRRHGLPTRIVSLEHEDKYRQQTQELAELHGVQDLIDVRAAPLVSTLAGDRVQPWYDSLAIEDLHDIGLLVIDGPPEATHFQARYPALPLLLSRLTSSAKIILDDAGRPDEKGMRLAWRSENPGLVDEYFQTEKGLAVLQFENLDKEWEQD